MGYDEDDGSRNSMNSYLIQYVVETSLHHTGDVGFDYEGNTFFFLFSQKQQQERNLRVRTFLRGSTAGRAQLSGAISLLPPILDALSFATGTPLILRHCEIILKDETGSQVRKAIFIGEGKDYNPHSLSANSVKEAKEILANRNGLKLPLRWLRYATYRKWAFDRFLFTWLALENLAEPTDIDVSCPNCGHHTVRKGAVKARIQDLVATIIPELSGQVFNKRFWDARQKVFHGGKEPESDFAIDLMETTHTVWKACEAEICRTYDLERRARTPLMMDLYFKSYMLVEWKSKCPEVAYADDYPSEAITEAIKTATFGKAEDEHREIGLQFLPIGLAKEW